MLAAQAEPELQAHAVAAAVDPLHIHHTEHGLLPQGGCLESQAVLHYVHGFRNHVVAGVQIEIVAQKGRPEVLGGLVEAVRPVDQGVEGGCVDVDAISVEHGKLIQGYDDLNIQS